MTLTNGSLLPYNDTNEMQLATGICVLVLGPFLSVAFGLSMVALGKIADAADVLRKRLEK